jgi:prolyl-tRNA synthetase
LSVRRDTGVKAPIPLSNIAESTRQLLETIQNDMFIKARTTYHEHIKEVHEWDDLVPALDAKNIVAIPWCEDGVCEDEIKERSAKA